MLVNPHPDFYMSYSLTRSTAFLDSENLLRMDLVSVFVPVKSATVSKIYNRYAV